MRWAQRAEESSSAVYGVKGVSILSQDIQLPECIPIDYMHAILEGVFKRLMGCWFNSSNHGKPYYIGRHVEAVNRMVARVSPPCEFRRAPRPIEVMSYWKSSEFHSWLLYFAIPILKSFLPPEYIHHLALLVSGVARARPMPGHRMGTLRLRVASYPGPAQLSAACSTEMQKQLGGSGGCSPTKFWNF